MMRPEYWTQLGKTSDRWPITSRKPMSMTTSPCIEGQVRALHKLDTVNRMSASGRKGSGGYHREGAPAAAGKKNWKVPQATLSKLQKIAALPKQVLRLQQLAVFEFTHSSKVAALCASAWREEKSPSRDYISRMLYLEDILTVLQQPWRNRRGALIGNYSIAAVRLQLLYKRKKFICCVWIFPWLAVYRTYLRS